MWVRMRQFCSLLTVPKYKHQRLVIDEVQNVVYTICKYGGLMLTGGRGPRWPTEDLRNILKTKRKWAQRRTRAVFPVYEWFTTISRYS